MDIIKIHLTSEDGIDNWYVSADKIAEYYFNGSKTRIGLINGNWILVEGNKTAELTKILTTHSNGKTFTL